MKVSNLKMYFISKSIKPGTVLALCLTFLLLTYYGRDYIYKKYTEHKQQYEDLQAKLFSLDGKIAKTKADQITWMKIKNRNFNTIGLRIEEAKKVIDALSKEHLINNLNVNLSTPMLRKDIMKSKMGLEYSEITINLSSYLDIEIYKFMDGLNTKIPGLFNYISFDMSSLEIVLDDKVLQDIKHGGYKDLVMAKMVIVWQDYVTLKDSDKNDTNHTN